ncbi:MAG TPA: pirin family protein [Polyangiaceae bacterium]|nr:pirin family protein [Polyangiaceae bacterium]
MINLRPAAERGHADHGWLDSYHSFSFADYYDPRHMGFRALRVINEDRVQPGRGFPSHPHRDMEIVSYVLDGALEHKDSLGTGSVIKPGDVQRMTAGTGVVHSEYNASRTDLVHFLQIWILPEQRSLTPGYEQKSFSTEEKRGRLRLVASRDGREGSVTVHQDVALYATRLDPGQRVIHQVSPGRHVYVQVTQGAITLGGEVLMAGDGAALSEVSSVDIEGSVDAEALLFDLA